MYHRVLLYNLCIIWKEKITAVEEAAAVLGPQSEHRGLNQPPASSWLRKGQGHLVKQARPPTRIGCQPQTRTEAVSGISNSSKLGNHVGTSARIPLGDRRITLPTRP